MSKQYLLEDQHRNSINLNTRIQLYEKFSTKKQGFHEWLFEKMDFKPGLKVLECGCGTAAIWYKNIDKLPSNLSVTLVDISERTLEDAKRNISKTDNEFTFEVADIQNLPFEAEYFDVVIANHMLYHVPDKYKAVSEVRRVLKKGGIFFASTFSKQHLKEIDELIELPKSCTSDSFTLENALDYICNNFDKITLLKHEDSLIITEAEPFINYVISINKGRTGFNKSSLDKFKSKVHHLIDEKKAIHVAERVGVFVSIK
ncbi:class I SAM-dependent methyltransferase [Bacillus mycoides]|uniref:Methyltransferase domain-containing protein n=1 Tax=Bacillus mycoides TaxID=1405 RepID=A0A1S9T0Z2_BACMY|nr:class I SAM-dependent methyltransferase [Bacillus mycoides]OOR03666.1 hypothetical protein BW900_25880 [Bacillus mycoides]